MSILHKIRARNYAGFNVFNNLFLLKPAPAQSIPLPKHLGLLLCSTLFLSACSGERPKDLGVNDGQLKSCPESPNCISSFAQDDEHKINPLIFSAEPKEVMQRVRNIVNTMDRTTVVKESENYLHVEFTSFVFRFVDDVEFYLDAKTGTLHVRSASRLGKSDLGVNRERIESIFTQLKRTDNKPSE